MKNKLWYLIKTGLKKKLSSKWFIIINILLLILIPMIINIDRIIKFFGGEFNEPTNVYVVDNVGVYDLFENNMNKAISLTNDIKIKINKTDKTVNELKEKIKEKENKDIIIYVENNNNEINATIISYEYVNTIVYQSIANALNNTKTTYSLMNSDIDKEELARIYKDIEIKREFISEDLNENEELMNTIGGVLVVAFIVPIFLLVVMIVNMIGAEINEEKVSKSMEIIISSVSPKVHFFSKIISTNIFIIIQGIIILLGGFIGLLTRGGVNISEVVGSFGVEPKAIVSTFVNSGIFSNIIKAIPFIIIMMILTFLAYSLLAGILASMTTSMEDYQQLQTPLVLIMLFAYYLAIIASAYESSIFIKIVSFIPFISGILAPVLLIIGQLSYIDVIISTLLLIIVNYVLVKYGLKIYKVGILNYSSNKLWKKIFKAIKE